MESRNQRSSIALLAVFMVALCGLALGSDLPESSDLQSGAAQQQRQLASLIEQLGNPHYAERRRAERQLAQLNFEAFDALQAAEDHDDLEIATRARYLLRLISIEWSNRDDPPAVRSLLKHYATAPYVYRTDLVERLARLPDAAGFNALGRIARFDRTQAISKHAALMLIAVKRASTDDGSDRSEQVIRESLGTSDRPAARWLHACLRTHNDPGAVKTDWDQLIRAEQESPTGDTIDQQDDLIAALLYTVGGLYLDVGDQTTGEQFARQALQIAPNGAAHHERLAVRLESHGRFDWAQREHRHALDLSGSKSEKGQMIARRLAFMFHDQLQDREAAIVLGETLQQQSDPDQVSKPDRAYVDFFYSVHYGRENDRPRQQEHLARAVKLDPTNADILIAMYHLPDADEDYRAKTLKLIQATAKGFEKGIKTTPDPTSLNQWAWLISNTEGDFDKAIKYSQMSLKSSRQMTQMAHRVAGTIHLREPLSAREEAG